MQENESGVEGSVCPDLKRRFLPYAILEFEKSHVFVDSISGTTENPFWEGDKTPNKFDVSQVAELTVYLYLRNPNAARGGQDIFLGATRVNPRFESHKEKTLGAEWLNVQDGIGKIRLGLEFVENKTLKISALNQLIIVEKGGSGSVLQVRKKDSQRLYALKTIRKVNTVSQSKVAHMLLSQINNPFIAPLRLAFQSPEKLYLFSPFISGGHLFYYLQREQRFDIDKSRFYTAELLCALECLHGFDITYCDLKPDNILLDSLGHTTPCDFGLCKLEKKDEDHTTFHGTLEYPTPELILGQAHNGTVGT